LLEKVEERGEICGCLSLSNPQPILSDQQGCALLLERTALAPGEKLEAK
jgi:hypothetical protein